MNRENEIESPENDYECPRMCGGGKGGARVAMREALARWRITESLWKKCLVRLADRSLDLWDAISEILERWKDASLSQPPSVSTTSGMKDIPFCLHA